MMGDSRPCWGDAFHRAPRTHSHGCNVCVEREGNGGKCMGDRGWGVARLAGIELEGDEWKEVRLT